MSQPTAPTIATTVTLVATGTGRRRIEVRRALEVRQTRDYMTSAASWGAERARAYVEEAGENVGLAIAIRRADEAAARYRDGYPP